MAPAALAAAPATSLAETLAGEAKADYEAGKMLYEDGDYAGSSLKFQRAYELSKNPRLLWNRAAAEKNLRHYVIVRDLVQAYLLEGTGYITDVDRADAEALIEAVSAFVSKLNVTVNQPGASIFINAKPVGKSPLTAPVLVDMGQHEIKVELAGYKPFTRMVQVAGGGTTAVDFALELDRHEGLIVVGHDAVIRVDGRMVGMGQWQGTLPSGLHTVEVSAKNKQTYVGEGLVQDNQTATLRINLQNEPTRAAPAASPAGVPTWLWVGGAVVLAAGASVGGYFLFKPVDKGPPAPVEGSLGTVELPFRRRF